MPVKPIRDGFHAITPYLFAQGASQLIDFISAAFKGEVTFRKTRPNGTLMHAEMRIGDSMLMVAEATEQFGPTPISIYLYVNDCDAVFQSALDSGGVAAFPIMTLPSGERYGGVKDPFGNTWWIATHVEACHQTKRRDAGRNSRCHKLEANSKTASGGLRDSKGNQSVS